jgi:hypothetical protein
MNEDSTEIFQFLEHLEFGPNLTCLHIPYIGLEHVTKRPFPNLKVLALTDSDVCTIPGY